MYTDTSVYTHTPVYTHILVYTHQGTHTHKKVHTHKHTHQCIHTHIQTQSMYTHTHTPTHNQCTHTHTHTHPAPSYVKSPISSHGPSGTISSRAFQAPQDLVILLSGHISLCLPLSCAAATQAHQQMLKHSSPPLPYPGLGTCDLLHPDPSLCP